MTNADGDADDRSPARDYATLRDLLTAERLGSYLQWSGGDVDAAFALYARYGVLDGKELGRQAALLLTDDIVVGQRVSTGLTECARAADAAVLPVLDALQELMTALPGRRDAGAFLELAADLAERSERAIDLPSEFRELAAGKSNSMLAKAARRLLR